MTVEAARDSALSAVSDAYRVLLKPRFLWAPILLIAITSLPLLAVPGYPAPPSELGAESAVALQQALLQTALLSMLLAALLGPLADAVIYTLGRQYVEGEEAEAFPTGMLTLTWRFFLQTFALLALNLVGLLGLALLFLVLQGVIGALAALFVAIVVAGIAVIWVAIRLAVAPVLLLSGTGPLEAIRRSWQLTRGNAGRVLRWLAVPALTVGIPAVIVDSAVAGVLDAANQVWVTPLVVGAGAPFAVVYAIVYVRLSRVLLLRSDPDWPDMPAPDGDTRFVPSGVPTT